MLLPHVGVAAAQGLQVCMSLSSQVCLLLFCLIRGLVGALEAVLDSNTEVAHFQVLLQVPGSQVYSPIACGEFLDGCDVHWAIATVIESTLSYEREYHIRGNQPALEVAGTESPPYSVFDYKDDMTSFVKGKVKTCHTSPVLYLTSRCSDHKFGDLEMVSFHSSKEREDKSPPLHPGHLTVVLQPLGSQNPDSHLVVEATPSLVCHGHWRLGNDHGSCGT
ncbi:TBC1 domain family member 8 [Sciurus carolinensis]|uniref:TBC1 domain family member 8 n=1 Tax=Sciurus carolinensis TaxID=30640 RepID=A0AA41T7P9_SCICA|nr:TBC1 domain family member 8 [Sciurus carolinensis]